MMADDDGAAAMRSEDSAGASPRQEEVCVPGGLQACGSCGAQGPPTDGMFCLLQADLLAKSGSVKAETWFKLYLEFLLLCAVRGPTWRQVSWCQRVWRRLDQASTQQSTPCQLARSSTSPL